MLPVNYVQSNYGGRVDGAPPSHDPRLRRSVFVGDLSFFCTEIDLANAFGRFGHVITVEIKRGRHGDSLLHGFVEFDNDASAERAIQFMNGRKWMGRRLRVNWTNISVATNPEEESWIQVHINFTCKDLTRKINEEFLEAVFVPFGGLADVTIKRHGCTGHPLQTTGYGFAYFKETFCALRAVHALRVIVVDGVRIESSLSRKAEAAISQSMGVAGKMPYSAHMGMKPPSPTLSGLHPGTDMRKIVPTTQATFPNVLSGGHPNHVFQAPHFPSSRHQMATYSHEQAMANSFQPMRPSHSSAQMPPQFQGFDMSDYMGNRAFPAKEASSADTTDSEFSGAKAFASMPKTFGLDPESESSSFRYQAQQDSTVEPSPVMAAQSSPYSLF